MTELYQGPSDHLQIREHVIDVDDEFVNEKFDDVNDKVRQLAELGTAYYASEGLDIARKRKSSIDFENNPATAEFIQKVATMKNWLETIPTAAALDPLYEPGKTTLPNGRPISEEAADWFRNVADARGIRSRAAVMEGILLEHASGDTRQQQWLSLASGAAQPVFAILSEIREQGGILPKVTLADKDKSALDLAQSYAQSHDHGSQITTKNANVLAKNGLAYERGSGLSGLASAAIMKAKGRFEKELFDAVEAVGIFEYLKRPDWKYTYNKVISTSTELAGAENFMKHAYELVKPGGILIVGNMLDTHPQLEFTLNVIQWPHIQPRAVNEMVDIMKTVDIRGEVDVYLPSDGVYAMYVIRKPK